MGTGTFNGSINELHQRFREQEVAIFKKHGAEIIGVWQHLGNPDTLVWMLAYRDRAHREEVWAKFAADPDWKALSSKYQRADQRERVHDERHGLLAAEVTTQAGAAFRRPRPLPSLFQLRGDLGQRRAFFTGDLADSEDAP